MAAVSVEKLAAVVLWCLVLPLVASPSSKFLHLLLLVASPSSKFLHLLDQN